MGDTLTTCIVLGAGETGNAGIIVEAQGSLLGVRVTARAVVAESMSSDCWKPSSLEGGQGPGLTDGNLFG